MRYIVFFLLSLVFVVNTAFAGQEEFFEEVSVDDGGATVTISFTATSLRAQSVTIVNNSGSANNVYYTVNSGDATTSNAYLQPGEARTIDSGEGAFPMTQVGLICDTGETATVRVFALPSK